MSELPDPVDIDMGERPVPVWPPRPDREAAATWEHLVRLARLVQTRVQALSNRVHTLADRIDAQAARTDALADAVQDAAASMLILEIVATVADLPANAPVRRWYRVQSGTLAERAAIYVGNGPNLPLTKVTTTAI